MERKLKSGAGLRSDLEWMDLQARVLYVHDARGRLRWTNESGARPAPRFWLGRTAVGNCWRFRHDLPDAALRRLARYAAREAPLAPETPPPPPERLASMRACLEADAPVTVWRGPAFRFPPDAADARETEEGRTSPPVRALRADDAPRLGETFAWLAAALDASAPCLAAFDEDRVVAACWSSRRHPAACEAGVETVAAERGRGLGRRVVAAWARAVRSEGREPLYSTSWENDASLGLARSLGLRRYGEDLHLT